MIYLDHNATTPLHPKALEAMLPLLRQQYGNPSSYHRMGRDARTALDTARRTAADCLGAEPGEILFTGSGTESDNLALRGAARAGSRRSGRIVTSTTEHHAVLETCRDLEREGFTVTFVPVDENGVVLPEVLRRHVSPDTILVSIHHANNETGVIQPVSELAAAAHNAGALFHTDAVQAAGKIQLRADETGADLISVSGHKIYGPKGVGMLYVRSGTDIAPCITGGSHESGLRAGTENVAGIAGFAAALALAVENLEDTAYRTAQLRDRLEAGIREAVPDIRINGAGAQRVPNTTNISFRSVEAESVLLYLDLYGICASAGSACTTGSPEPSAVLLAMGLPAEEAQSALRFSLGTESTREQIDTTVQAVVEIIKKLRAVSSLSTEKTA